MFEQPCASNDLSPLLFLTRSSHPGCENPAPVTFVSCNGVDSGDSLVENGASQVNLSFEYEIHTSADSDVVVAMEEFESELLGGVADELGLLSCTGSVRKHRQGSNVRGLESEADIGGLSSEPIDEFSSVDCASASVKSSSMSPSVCTSILGFMTAWVPAQTNRRQLSSSKVYAAIEDFMAKGYTSDSVVGVSYIGSDIPDTDLVVSEAKSNTDTAGSFGSIGTIPLVALLVVALSVMALVAVLSAMKTRRLHQHRGQSAHAMAVDACLDDLTDLEVEHTETSTKQVQFASEPCDIDEVSSVATEEYTMDKFIRRITTYGSEWGDWSRSLSFNWMPTTEIAPKDTRNTNDEASLHSLPSEVGEEVQL